MEYRKVIGFGKGSYVISLPKGWALKNKLKKGSTLSVETGANSMVVSTNLVEEIIDGPELK